MNGTGIGLVSFSCPASEVESNLIENAIYERVNVSKCRTIFWILCALSGLDLEGAQMEKYLTPACMKLERRD